MNKVILMGRLTRNPDVRYSNSANGDNMCIARYTLAVDRRFSRRNSDGDNQQNADFISCVAFGKQGEFAEKYLKQGTKIAATGRIQTGSYTNKARRFIQLRLLSRNRNLQKAKMPTPDHREMEDMFHSQHHRQVMLVQKIS